jgi:hypothetical protein
MSEGDDLGRNESKAKKLKDHPDLQEWEIEEAKDLAQLTADCKSDRNNNFFC